MPIRQLTRALNVDQFRSYARDQLGPDIATFLGVSHDASGRAKYGRYSEGTLRAAAFAVLRIRLQSSWVIQAETKYPAHAAHTGESADIIVWSPNRREEGPTPIVIEVKKSASPAKLGDDIAKIQAHIRMRSSDVRYGYILFPVDSTWTAAAKEWRHWRGKKHRVEAIPVPLR